jgi:hypothetical protein
MDVHSGARHLVSVASARRSRAFFDSAAFSMLR